MAATTNPFTHFAATTTPARRGQDALLFASAHAVTEGHTFLPAGKLTLAGVDTFKIAPQFALVLMTLRIRANS